MIAETFRHCKIPTLHSCYRLYSVRGLSIFQTISSLYLVVGRPFKSLVRMKTIVDVQWILTKFLCWRPQTKSNTPTLRERLLYGLLLDARTRYGRRALTFVREWRAKEMHSVHCESRLPSKLNHLRANKAMSSIYLVSKNLLITSERLTTTK